MTKQTSLYLKGFFALSVVCAHTQAIPLDATMGYYIIRAVFRTIGCLGVPGFFILSGYAFSFNHRTFIDFWRSKACVVVPWLVWGCAYAAIDSIVNGTVLSPVYPLVGWAGSYYLVSLCVFFLIFWPIHSDSSLISIVIISVASQLLTAAGIIPADTLSPYLNPMNWAGWFSLGILAKRHVIFDRIFQQSKRERLLFSAPVQTVALSAIVVGGVYLEITYWSPLYIPFSVLSLLLIYLITMRLFEIPFLQRIMCTIGSNSMFVMYSNYYLALASAKLLGMIAPSAYLIAPFFVLLFINTFCAIIKYLPRRLSHCCSLLLGIR